MNIWMMSLSISTFCTNLKNYPRTLKKEFTYFHQHFIRDYLHLKREPNQFLICLASQSQNWDTLELGKHSLNKCHYNIQLECLYIPWNSNFSENYYVSPHLTGKENEYQNIITWDKSIYQKVVASKIIFALFNICIYSLVWFALDFLFYLVLNYYYQIPSFWTLINEGFMK